MQRYKQKDRKHLAFCPFYYHIWLCLLQDKKYFFNYAWSLIDFLKRKNGITNFLEEGSQWHSYVKQSSKYKNKRDEEALENWAKKDYQGTTLF